MSALSIYRLAEERDVDVDFIPMGRAQSLSMPFESKCVIAIDPRKLRGSADEKVKLGHELGHCLTGSFYSKYAARDLRQRHELHADRWAIAHLIPRRDLEQALARGYREVWDLADHFEVTEPFMRKALVHYHML